MATRGPLRGAVIAFVLAGIGLAACDHAAAPHARAADASVTTRGRVIDLDCADGGAVTYAFNAGGQAWQSRAAASAMDCANAQVGDTVVVAYVPADPDSSRPVTSPRRRHWTLTKDGWIALCSLVLMGAMLSIALRRSPAR